MSEVERRRHRRRTVPAHEISGRVFGLQNPTGEIARPQGSKAASGPGRTDQRRQARSVTRRRSMPDDGSDHPQPAARLAARQGGVAADRGSRRPRRQPRRDEGLRRRRGSVDWTPGSTSGSATMRGSCARQTARTAARVPARRRRFVIVADLPKRDRLGSGTSWRRSSAEIIRQAGDDPAQYVRTDLKVARRAYGVAFGDPSAVRAGAHRRDRQAAATASSRPGQVT